VDNMERKYCNFTLSELSIFDFNFIFGVRTRALVESESYDKVAEIFMSPQHAKAFALMLMKDVEAYEKNFGVIQLEPLQEENNKG